MAAGLGLAWAMSAGAGEAGDPAPGRYDAQLCVALSASPPSCGPAQVTWRRSGEVTVGIADVVYRLKVGPQLLGVVLMHGAMQIDEFDTRYRWQGRTLQFDDLGKGAHYELQLGKPMAVPRKPASGDRLSKTP